MPCSFIRQVRVNRNNKKYKSKIGKRYPTTLESQSAESIKTISKDDFEIFDLDNTDDNILLKEVQLTSE